MVMECYKIICEVVVKVNSESVSFRYILALIYFTNAQSTYYKSMIISINQYGQEFQLNKI